MSVPRAHETLRIERAATGGGLAHLSDGRVVFVRHALIGELVEADVLEITSSFARADATRVIESSPERVDPPCPYAGPGRCGGCDLQHATPAAQQRWKADLVAEQLRRIAHVDWHVEVRDAGPVKGYRTRLRCGVNERGYLGLRASRSHEMVPIGSCYIADERFSEAFTHEWTGATEVELRAIGNSEPFAVLSRGAETRVEIRTLGARPLSTPAPSRVAVGANTFQVSAQSFWQAHRAAPELLTREVLRMAQAEERDSVVDLFSGVGLFSVPLAQRVGRRGRVTAVEASPHAVRDARLNVEGLDAVRVRQRSVSARSMPGSVARGDIVVLDPPRGGLARGAAAALAACGPRRIVYVSCDAATFARDLRELSGGGYVLSDLVAYDFFPMTEHVELVGLLDTGP